MTIALRNFNGTPTPIRCIQENGNLRILLVICGSIAVPSLALAFFLGGWLQYVFVAVIAVNIAVPVIAYAASLHPPGAMPEEDPARQRLVFEDTALPVIDRVSAEKITDKVQ